MQNNFSKNQNPESTINKPNPKYSHLSEDAQKFLEHCDKHDVPSIQKHTGRDAEFKTRPFQSNGNGDMPDYLCVRFLASVSYRKILTAWSIYELKDDGFLLTNENWQRPGFSHFHLTFDTLEEIRQHSMAPVEVVLDAKKALRKFREIDTESELKDEPERQPMIGIPTQETQPRMAIKPKKRKSKLKTEAELKKLSAPLEANRRSPLNRENRQPLTGSDALLSNFRKFRSKDSSSDGVGWERRGLRSKGRQLNVDIHVPTTEENYWLMGRGEF